MTIKSKMITAAVGSVVVLGAATMVQTTVRDNDDDDYVLSSKWNPAAMHNSVPVRISVKVDGTEIMFRKRRVSPWGHTMTAESGARVELTAWAAWGDTVDLDCMIMKNNKIVPGTGYDSRRGPGWVKCTA